MDADRDATYKACAEGANKWQHCVSFDANSLYHRRWLGVKPLRADTLWRASSASAVASCMHVYCGFCVPDAAGVERPPGGSGGLCVVAVRQQPWSKAATWGEAGYGDLHSPRLGRCPRLWRRARTQSHMQRRAPRARPRPARPRWRARWWAAVPPTPGPGSPRPTCGTVSGTSVQPHTRTSVHHTHTAWDWD